MNWIERNGLFRYSENCGLERFGVASFDLDLVRDILEEVERLPERLRAVAEAVWIGGEPLMEVGRQHNVTKERARQLSMRAKRLIRNRLAEFDLEEWEHKPAKRERFDERVARRAVAKGLENGWVTKKGTNE